jgi:hypothetical protein
VRLGVLPRSCPLLLQPEPAWQRTSPDAAAAAAGGRRRITKSRYSSVDGYISNSAYMRDEYNDVPFEADAEAYDTLRANGALACCRLGARPSHQHVPADLRRVRALTLPPS